MKTGFQARGRDRTLSVVVGYVVMAILVMLSFAPMFMAPELAFRSGSGDASPAFACFSLLMSGLAAIAGGYVTAVIAGKGKRIPVRVLGGLVLVFGLISAVAGMSLEAPTVSPDEIAHMTPMERAQKGHEPLWYALLLPFIGCGGVVAGGAIRNRR